MKKKKRKAQIAIFIIIAIILFTVILIYLLVHRNIIWKNGDVANPEIKPIYSFVQSCLKETAEDSIDYIGMTGGYYSIPVSSVNNTLAYYYDKGKNLMPSKSRIEKEIGDYVDEMLITCVDNFKNFPDFEVKNGKIYTSVKIDNDKVVFYVSYPLTISKGNKNYAIKSFNSEIKVRLEIIYDSVFKIIEKQIANPRGICLNCLNDIAEKQDLYIEMNDYGNETVIFTIIDKNSTINGKEYKYYFANKYEIQK